VSVYLDASVLVALFTEDPFTSRAESFLRSFESILVVSDFAAAEFASAIAREVRTRDMTHREARIAFSGFDTWMVRVAQRVEIGPPDVKAAEAILRRLDLKLRTPDAINIAIAQRIGAALFTFDNAMMKNARALGTPMAGT
jgi:predicted nucleic acid-binding protein